MCSKSPKILLQAENQIEGSKEAKTLEKKYGFTYRQIVGELIFAFITTRTDIGAAVTTLAQYNNNPGDKHFCAAQQVMAYLIDTQKRSSVLESNNTK